MSRSFTRLIQTLVYPQYALNLHNIPEDKVMPMKLLSQIGIAFADVRERQSNT